MAKSSSEADYNAGVCIWLERDGQVVLREPGAGLLEAVGRLQSIGKAAEEVGVSYRTAWTILQSINEAAGEPLVETSAGGSRGGGATITPAGRRVLAIYRKLQERLQVTAAKVVQRATLRPTRRKVSATATRSRR